MKVRSLIPSVLFAALAGCAGYLCHSPRAGGPERLQTSEVTPLDAFVSVHSFSEVETVKGVLQALCSRYLLEAREHRVEEIVRPMRLTRGEANPQRKPGSARTIALLERAIEEFKNTEQELVLTQDLLSLLSHEGLDRQWLDLYLSTLYRQPTADIIGQSARQAIEIGRTLRRSDEVSDAFHHVRMIPFEFAAKRQVERAQDDARLASSSYGLLGGEESELVILTQNQCIP